MNNKRKNRAGPARTTRPRPIAAEGVYNNAHFMHAATSHVGNTVQVQTQSGSVWEGVFRTFSSQFEVVLEVAHRIEPGQGADVELAVDSVVEKLIFRPSDIVSVVAKDVDLDYATRDTFQTDTAISRSNGQPMRCEEREFEPWVGSVGMNGEGESLEFDQATNGWDAVDMFKKNETVYGVQSTFDQSLTGYTLQLQKKDTQDYRDAEAKAAEIANEIENQPSYKTRAELENGDEEDRFAAVSRPRGPPSPPECSSGKYVPPAKRKNPQSGKLVRSTPPPAAPTSPAPPKGYVTVPPPNMNNIVPVVVASQQPNTPQGYIQHGPPPFPPHMHNQPPPLSSSAPPPKINGEGSKPMPQRPPRGYVHQTPPQNFSEPPPSIPIQAQIPLGKPPIHVPPPLIGVPSVGPPPDSTTVVVQHGPHGPTSTNIVGAQPQHNTHMHVAPSVHNPNHNVAHNVTHAGPHVVSHNTHNVPPPSVPQRRGRDEQVQELRKFQQDFKLAPSVNQQTLPPVPSHHQQHQLQQVQQQQQQVQQQQQQHQQQAPQEVTVSSVATPVESPITKNQSQVTSPNVSNEQSPTSLSSTNQSPELVDKLSTSLKKSTLNPNAKEFVLNPAAKPFTPRSPSTPNPSRPHTPQTPGPSLTQGYPGGPVPTPLPMLMPAYMMPSQATYQTPPHPQVSQPNRFRKGFQMAASQMQVAAATGQPLLAPAPLQQFMPYPHPQGPHPQHLPSQPYSPMMRMYHHHESPPQHQIQYLAPPPQSTTPSPGQPQQYHPGGPQQSPAPPQGPQFPIMCPLLPAPPPAHVMSQYIHGQGPPHQPHHIQVLLPHPHNSQ